MQTLFRSRTLKGHNDTISDKHFVVFCLKRVLFYRTFNSIQELEKAILSLDEFGIFQSEQDSVRCALQPFVRDGYKRSTREVQDKFGVCVYYIGNSEAVGISCDGD
jgi:hypothetical protein